jgi:hypothetical protein
VTGGGSFTITPTPTGLALTNYQPSQPPSPVFITVSADNGRFGTLDLSTGIFTQTGTTIPSIVNCMTRVGTGTLLGTDQNASLRSVNPADGSSSLIGNSGAGLYGIAERSDGQLFGVSYHNIAASLYTINPTNGSATLIGPLGVGTHWYNVAMDDAGTLFMADAPGRGSNSNLYTVDTTTGIATLVGPIGTGGNTMSIDSLVFVEGVLYGFIDNFNVTAGLAQFIVTIDPVTGAGTPLRSYASNGLGNVYGAVPTAIPGDFNHDGTVDAADYVVWRKTGGSPADYNSWRANFGQTFSFAGLASSASANGAVTEPASLVLLMFAVGNCYLRRGRAT